MPFCCRCIFHYIEFPDEGLMSQIIRVHYPDLEDAMLTQVLKAFYQLRAMNGLQKKPRAPVSCWLDTGSCSLGVWTRLFGTSHCRLWGHILKKNEDIELVRRRQE